MVSGWLALIVGANNSLYAWNSVLKRPMPILHYLTSFSACGIPFIHHGHAIIDPGFGLSGLDLTSC